MLILISLGLQLKNLSHKMPVRQLGSPFPSKLLVQRTPFGLVSAVQALGKATLACVLQMGFGPPMVGIWKTKGKPSLAGDSNTRLDNHIQWIEGNAKWWFLVVCKIAGPRKMGGNLLAPLRKKETQLEKSTDRFGFSHLLGGAGAAAHLGAAGAGWPGGARRGAELGVRLVALFLEVPFFERGTFLWLKGTEKGRPRFLR